jgi:hypothetical protein
MKLNFGKDAGLILTIALTVDCAVQAQIRKAESGVELSPAPIIANGLAGNTLSQWVDRTPNPGSSPQAGEDCAMIYDPRQHRLVLFGGKNDDDQNLNEVWALELAKNIWQKIDVEGVSPPASEDHAVIYDPISHRMILHGGENGLTWNHTWVFDLQTQRWRNMTDSTAPAREDHTAIFDSRGKRMVIFGGRRKTEEDDEINKYDLWALDLDPGSPGFEKWQNLSFDEKHPSGRSDHVAVFDSLKNRMLIFGGWDKKEKEYLDDTWAFYFAPLDSGDSMGRWKKIKTKKSHPPERRHAVSVFDAGRNWLILCGGFGDEGYLNDVWAFDLNLDEWINITPGPQPRIDHQAIYDPQRHCLILYGGDARLQGKFHDLWELQIRSDLPSRRAGLTREVATKITEK